MRRLKKVVVIILSITLILSACSIFEPENLSYTQLSDPKEGHLLENGSVIYEPEGDIKGKIFIDPGHGYSDPGTLALDYETSSLSESMVVFDMSVRLMILHLMEFLIHGTYL